MLFTQSVTPDVLKLIRSLQCKAYLQGFNLVGGTALSLYWGHRKSIDIDLFSDFTFDTGRLLEDIQQDFPFELFLTAANTLKGGINNIKVDFLAHRYHLIKKPVIESGLILLHEHDILAMKLNTISISGQRSKDFIDIWYALKKYQIADIVGFYRLKYNQPHDSHVLKSLIFFDDVDLADWPELLINPDLKWEDIRKDIEKKVLHYIKDFNY
jgi:hypothetical protein